MLKLSHKIILGFSIAITLTLITSVIVIVLLRPVTKGAGVTVDVVSPVMKASNDLNNSTAASALYAARFTRNYDTTLIDPLRSALTLGANNLATLKEVLSRPLSMSVFPASAETIQRLETNYTSYRVNIENMLNMGNKILTARANIMASQDNLGKLVNSYHELKRGIWSKTSQTTNDPVILEPLAARENAANQLKLDALAIKQFYWETIATANPDNFKKLFTVVEGMKKIIAAESQLVDSADANQLEAISAELNKYNNLIIDQEVNLRQINDLRISTFTLGDSMNGDIAKVLTGSIEESNIMAIEGKRGARIINFATNVGAVASLLVCILAAFLIIRSIMTPINRIIGSLADGAHSVDETSDQLSSSANMLAEGASENAASLEETSAALEELSSMTKRNADNSVEANALVTQAGVAVDKATQSMSSVTIAMKEISDSGQEIGKIIKTIDEIAFQTNLLALNAAVEAARAGEAGAGFAVVADEVRNLAIRSAEAAKNTADLIASTISNINSGSDLVHLTEENFQTVVTHTAKVAELVSEVAEASKEQAQGIGQINQAMTQMDKVTQQNASNAEESASAATELSDQASRLLDAVESLTMIVSGEKKSAGSAALQRPKPQKRQYSSAAPLSLTASSERFSSPARGASPAPAKKEPGKGKVVKPEDIIPMDDDFSDF